MVEGKGERDRGGGVVERVDEGERDRVADREKIQLSLSPAHHIQPLFSPSSLDKTQH
jgi:hypothetical protein